MAVSYVAGYVDSGGSSETITLDGSGTNRVILGGIFSNQSSVNTYTGITINSTALSGITSDSVDGGIAAINGYGYLLDTDHPGAGAFAMATTPVIGGVYSAIELQGADQTTPLGSQVVNTDTAVADGGTVSCTLTGASGSFAIVFIGSADGVETATANHGLPAGATLIGDVKSSKKNFRIGYISSVASSSETYNFTVSVDGASEVDSVIVGAIEINASGAADTVPPTYTSTPAVTATSTTGHTIAQTIDEDGFVYGVRLANGGLAPTPAQVKAGLDGNGDPADEAKNASASAGVSVDLVFSTGAPATTYDYYFIAEDDEATRNIQALVSSLLNQTTSPEADSITSVSGDDVIRDAESPVAVTWTSGATGTSTPTINSVTQSNYTITDDLNSSFELVWPQTSYGATVELAIDAFTRDVSIIPQTGRSYVTLASYVEGSADITATASLVDGDQLEYDSTDSNGNTVSISAAGIVTITLASGQTEPGSFDVRAISGGDRGPWQTIAASLENLGPTISGSVAPTVESGNIFQVDYTIPNMDGQTPTISGTDAGSFTFTNVSGDIWRLESAALAIGTYNVTINADDGLNTAVTLNVVLTVTAVVVPGFTFSDLNPLTNSDSHPTSPGTVRASETFTVDILEGLEDTRQLIRSLELTTDASGNLADIATGTESVGDFILVIGSTYECCLRSSAGDGFVFERTATDVS